MENNDGMKEIVYLLEGLFPGKSKEEYEYAAVKVMQKTTSDDVYKEYIKEDNESDNPIYIYRDAVDWIKNETGIDKCTIIDVLESEEQYMANIGLMDGTHIREGLELEDQ